MHIATYLAEYGVLCWKEDYYVLFSLHFYFCLWLDLYVCVVFLLSSSTGHLWDCAFVLLLWVFSEPRLIDLVSFATSLRISRAKCNRFYVSYLVQRCHSMPILWVSHFFSEIPPLSGGWKTCISSPHILNYSHILMSLSVQLICSTMFILTIRGFIICIHLS